MLDCDIDIDTDNVGANDNDKGADCAGPILRKST